MRLVLAATFFLLAGAAARAEGALSIYAWGNSVSPDLIDRFEAAYNVKVSISEYDDDASALDKARSGNADFDIAAPSQINLPLWIREGLALPTHPGGMENGKYLSSDWTNPDFDPGRLYSAPWQLGTVGIAVNTNVYKGPLDSWSVIFNPPDALKGKINVVPEMDEVIFAAIAYNGGVLCTDDPQTLTKARDTLLEARKNWKPMAYGTIEKMLTGEIAATVDWNGSALRKRLQTPAVRFVQPKEGMPVWSDNIVVLRGAQNLQNALLFQNFVMHPRNAAMISAFTKHSNGIAGSERFLPADIKGAPELAIAPHARANAVKMKTCDPATEELYRYIWAEIRD